MSLFGDRWTTLENKILNANPDATTKGCEAARLGFCTPEARDKGMASYRTWAADYHGVVA